jgi:subtilase family serine protease
MSNGTVSVAATAQPITTTGSNEPLLGHQIKMGDNFYFHIRPEVAQQWIDVLGPIAEGK